MALSAILAAAIAGVLGGLHCAAMCGGWLAAFSIRRTVAPLVPARTLVIESAAGHLGRIATYTMLGAALGASGGEAFAVAWEPLQRSLYVLANLMLLALAVTLARGATRRDGLLENAGLHLFRRLLPAVKTLSSQRRIPARLALGLIWGATPCALVYGVLPLALLSGSARDGALIMLAFGFGTLPNLLGAAYVLARFRAWYGSPAGRIVAGFVVGGFATYGIYRALFMTSALGQSPFCLPGWTI
ncbi:MAG TPA: sulfite exporter TauE/SafE family protein [Casimicrobiaceae bacterium]